MPPVKNSQAKSRTTLQSFFNPTETSADVIRARISASSKGKALKNMATEVSGLRSRMALAQYRAFSLSPLILQIIAVIALIRK
jgi:hypothetical protein